MSNKPAPTPTLSNSADPQAPDYAVPDAKEAWERFDRLVGKVVESPKEKKKSSHGESVTSLTVNVN